MRLIDADALEKTISEEFHGISATGFIYFMRDKTPIEVYNRVRDLIDNAPTIKPTVTCKECDGYEAGYSAGQHDARPQGELAEKLKDRIEESVCKYCQMNKHCELCEISRVFQIITLTAEEQS